MSIMVGVLVFALLSPWGTSSQRRRRILTAIDPAQPRRTPAACRSLAAITSAITHSLCLYKDTTCLILHFYFIIKFTLLNVKIQIPKLQIKKIFVLILEPSSYLYLSVSTVCKIQYYPYYDVLHLLNLKN